MTSCHRSSCSRRRLLAAAPAAFAAAFVAGCAKKEPAACMSTLGLMPDEIRTRESLGYQDRGPDPNKLCAECTQYLEPDTFDRCGDCKVMKGPIHPRGTCNVFTPKA